MERLSVVDVSLVIVLLASGGVERRYRWWHGVVFYAGVQVARLALKAAAGRRTAGVGYAEDQNFYEAEKLPVFAPPAAAFPILWTINSVASIAGGLHVANLAPGTPGRGRFLQLQAGAWAIFSAFEAGYFGLRSPLNAAALTLGYSAFILASLRVALREMHDPRAAASLAPTIAWLALANPLGIAQAAFNYDAFWKVGPLIHPKASWTRAK